MSTLVHFILYIPLLFPLSNTPSFELTTTTSLLIPFFLFFPFLPFLCHSPPLSLPSLLLIPIPPSLSFLVYSLLSSEPSFYLPYILQPPPFFPGRFAFLFSLPLIPPISTNSFPLLRPRNLSRSSHLSPLSPSSFPSLSFPFFPHGFPVLLSSILSSSSLFSYYIVLRISASTHECFLTQICAFPDPDISVAGAVPVHPCSPSPSLSLCLSLCPSRSSLAFICLCLCLCLCFCPFFV